ncbi:hypothetical protein C8R45DRAFT_935488 [Mycena sanguinolenta]|nr:hypothetical protein C8R45DRAFT_935488 [Mycena sanguinolenta]
MATTTRSTVDQDFLDSLSDRKLIEFRQYLFSSTYITHNASKFLDTEWVDIALLRDYLEQSSQHSASDASATRFSADNQQYLDALSNRQLFSAAFIRQNANKFLDHDWVDIDLLKDYSTQKSPNPASSASTMRSTTVPDAVHVKIEAQPLFAVKVEPHKIIEISSDSEPDAEDGGDSDLEVIEALQHTSRSSSTIPPSDPDQFQADTDCEPDPGGKASRLKGEFRPTQKTTVERMEYRDGPASIYPIHRVRTGIVVDLSDPKYWFRDPKTKALLYF